MYYYRPALTADLGGLSGDPNVVGDNDLRVSEALTDGKKSPRREAVLDSF